MRRFLFLVIWGALSWTVAAAPAGTKTQKEGVERISKETMLKRDELLRYSVTNPCPFDKYNYFCCPVRKIVRRNSSGGKWTDYCYNGRDELIGIRKRDHSGAVKRSDFSALSGCTQCGNSRIKHHSWKHDTRPRVVLPKKKKRR